MGWDRETVLCEEDGQQTDRPFSHCPYLFMKYHNSYVVTHMEAGEIDSFYKKNTGVTWDERLFKIADPLFRAVAV